MRRVALHRLDQVRDEIRSALQLHVDVRPAGLRLVAQADEVVVDEDCEDEQRDHDSADDDPDDHDVDTRSRGSRGDGRRRGPAPPAADRALREAGAADRRARRSSSRCCMSSAQPGSSGSRSSPVILRSRSSRCSSRSACGSSASRSRSARRTRCGAGSDGLPALVLGADTVFTPGRHRAASPQTPGHAIAGRRDPPPSPPHRYALRIEDGRITKVLDDDPANTLAAAPLWRLGEKASTGRCSTTSAGRRTSWPRRFSR